LSRTPASAGNRKTWTWAGWVKRSALGAAQEIFAGGAGGTDATQFEIGFASSDILFCWGASTEFLNTTQVFRDVSAWYHIVVSFDTTQATANNRLKLYVNGAEVTTFSTNNRASLTQNGDFGVNQAALHTIGRRASAASWYLNGYLADIYFIDGQALTPSSFTETDATTGQLIPKAFSGSYGSQGWHLEFADNSSNTATTLGKDTSGNGNHWLPNNLSIITGGPTSVASASGALPVYNTTDTYGTTKGTGTRTDANASSLVLAIPMDGANNGTTFTDESSTIKGSGSSKSITRTNAVTSTAQSKFYGSSGYFDGNTDYLTTATSTDFDWRTSAFTIEMWVYNISNTANYRGGPLQAVYGSPTVDTTDWSFGTDNNGKAKFYYWNGAAQAVTGASTVSLNTWTHVAATHDGSGSIKVYVNGILDATGTKAGTPDFGGSNSFVVGATNSSWYNGYISDLRIYKGAVKYTSNFNPPSSTQNAAIAAGNDSLVDVPTNGSQTDTGVGGEVRGNYCTWNPLDKASAVSLANGNLDASSTSTGEDKVRGTIAMPVTGKWFYEVTIGSTYAGYIGIASASAPLTGGTGAKSYGYNETGRFYTDGSFTSGQFASFVTGDVIGVAVDTDADTLSFYKNGTQTGTAKSIDGTYQYFPVLNIYSGSFVANFGQRPFAYTAPSGFKALNTANLPTPAVVKSNTVFDTVLWTGNDTGQTITMPGPFSPDLVWTKTRSTANAHWLFDVIRGTNQGLSSSSTTNELTRSSSVTAFGSTGFTLGTSADVNSSAYTYVAWAWDAGSSTDTNNTAGTITPTGVRANATAGFSIVTYTGTGANATVGHGLGVAPQMIIVKTRSAGNSWKIYHSGLTSAAYNLEFTTGAQLNEPQSWNSTAPTSTVFSVGTQNSTNQSGATQVAYCFAPVVGYSSFGSFSGGSNVFTYTGFRPKWLLIKLASSSGTSWVIYDSVRDSYNVMGRSLYANLSDSEFDSPPRIDFLSNGFVTRASSPSEPSYSGTVIYASFAETPFNYARAR
jgi:hypothetical protein